MKIKILEKKQVQDWSVQVQKIEMFYENMVYGVLNVLVQMDKGSGSFMEFFILVMMWTLHFS